MLLLEFSFILNCQEIYYYQNYKFYCTVSFLSNFCIQTITLVVQRCYTQVNRVWKKVIPVENKSTREVNSVTEAKVEKKRIQKRKRKQTS